MNQIFWNRNYTHEEEDQEKEEEEAETKITQMSFGETKIFEEVDKEQKKRKKKKKIKKKKKKQISNNCHFQKLVFLERNSTS